ncbi:RES family NAD+ phosphorylase [Paenibacillus polysaccharolyticus]|uniref:RES family NAD+ phosphorylase n=1 Tax=Paenibacillus polysaccharolyticus TaxID=582692 RepID=UPI00209C94E3|nr:RES family NAD+ phosphorylase [Paenibacillus polysaccharolyticus]MCP1135306.1 RES family NAD+ phosphorylase [Paenibacillus polysaccharolyticus]
MNIYVANNDDAMDKYKHFVKLFQNNRFLIDQDNDFIKHYLSGLATKTYEVKKGQQFYRARINGLTPFKKDDELGAPPDGHASYGRVNPKGISYLYVAETEDTVIAEIQPWLGSSITIAECTALESLKVVDLLPSQEEISAVHSYRKVISREFSKPVRPETKELDYIPTQYIAEWFKNKGIDGVRYESALHFGGVNIAFFDPTKLQVRMIKEVNLKEINYKTE